MGLFSKSKKEVIPEVGGSKMRDVKSGRPVSPSPSNAPSYRSTAPSYVPPSQGGAGYGAQTNHWSRPEEKQQYGAGGPAQGQGYGGAGQKSSSGAGDRYARPQQSSAGSSWGGSSARNELLAGAPARGGASSASSAYRGQDGGDRYGGAGGQQSQEYNDEDEEVEGIKQQMRFVKQESLASTRNALRIAQEAEETARATLDTLGDQSDRIANAERHVDLAKAHNDRAQDETKELEALNRSIFRPTMTWNKAGKRDKEERRILDRHNAEKGEREQTRRDQFESRQRIDNAYRGMDREAENSAGARARAKARGAERNRYQFEATASDDDVEDEIDHNLDIMGDVVGRLKQLATTAGQEVDSQNQKLGKLGDKVDRLDNNVVRSTQRLARVK